MVINWLNLKERFQKSEQNTRRAPDPFWVIVQKEVADHIRSWRYIIMLALIALTCLGSLYTAMMTIREAADNASAEDIYLFLKLFTLSGETGLPPFIQFVGFLGPLLGIALGFDAINSERNNGTLSRMMSQPVPRDYVLNAKFVAALVVISVLFFALGFLVMGTGIVMFGLPPTFESFMRVICFLLLSIVYVAFWLNLSILFSVRFRQAATSALSSLAIWLFFSVFYTMIVRLIGQATVPARAEIDSVADIIAHQKFVLFLLRLSPTQLFSEATTTLLTPSVRTLGPLTMQQVVGAIPSPLPLMQSLLLVWPHVTGLVAATVICFGIAYYMFMRQEIRSRS